MDTTLYLLAALALGLSALLLFILFRMRTHLSRFEHEVARLADPEHPYEPSPRIIVELSDPLELARRESKMARLVSGQAPSIVIKKTYEQVVREMALDMRERDVDANIQIAYF